jgi:NAD-dependent SIR2 family protein deacetylase
MSALVFLGAGASAADAAPIQSTLFREYFRHLRNRREIHLGQTSWSPETALPIFMDEFFGIDTRKDDIDSIQFPTFEEALAVLELAIQRREGFGQMSYGMGNTPRDYPTMQQMRFILIQVLTTVIPSQAEAKVHAELCRNLDAQGLLNSVAFATTNYDPFIDHAILSVQTASKLDYGFHLETPFSSKPPQTATVVLHLHGSLQWLCCQSCLGVYGPTDIPSYHRQCPKCGDWVWPLIVPPTFFKEMNQSILTAVWRSFQMRLLDVNHVIFCGYSFPDADMHVKYAFKWREIIGRRNPLKVTIINEHPGKSTQARDDEKGRYERFFRLPVDYTPKSFEEFATNPSAFLGVT